MSSDQDSKAGVKTSEMQLIIEESEQNKACIIPLKYSTFSKTILMPEQSVFIKWKPTDKDSYTMWNEGGLKTKMIEYPKLNPPITCSLKIGDQSITLKDTYLERTGMRRSGEFYDNTFSKTIIVHAMGNSVYFNFIGTVGDWVIMAPQIIYLNIPRTPKVIEDKSDTTSSTSMVMGIICALLVLGKLWRK